MKKLILALALLSATPALAITREIHCTNAGNGDNYLLIQLRGGNATLFECDFNPCTKLDADAQAVSSDGALSYRITASKLPYAQSTLDVEFPDQPGGEVMVRLDGAYPYTNCQ